MNERGRENEREGENIERHRERVREGEGRRKTVNESSTQVGFLKFSSRQK